MAEDRTETLSITSRTTATVVGVVLLVAAVALAVVGIVEVAQRASKNAVVFVVIPLLVVVVFVLAELAIRIMRLRVVVSPTTITTYNRTASRMTPSLMSERTVHTVGVDRLSAVVVREYGQVGGARCIPFMIVDDGAEIPLDALTAPAQGKDSERQHELLDRIHEITGVRVDSGFGAVPGVTGHSGIMPPPLPVPRAEAAAAQIAAPDYPAPAGPPEHYDPARWEGVAVPDFPPRPREGTQAGWLIDPASPAHYRYFDGTRWTEWVYNGMAVSAAHLVSAPSA